MPHHIIIFFTINEHIHVIVVIIIVFFIIVIKVIIEIMIDFVELGVDIGFGKVIFVNYLLNSSVPLDKLKLLRAADAASERKHTALFRVFARRRMSYT